MEQKHCYYCKNLLSRYTSCQLCTICKYDPEIIISYTDAKRKYKLTKEEIYDAELFHITFKIHGTIGTKYLIDDVEKLAYRLIKKKKLKIFDKCVCAYNKQKEIMDKVRERKKEIEKRSKLIKRNLKYLVLKLDSKIKINRDKYILNLIEKYSNELDINVCDAITVILEDIEKEVNRKKKMEDLINNEIDEEYKIMARSHPSYKGYIYNKSTNVELYFSDIKNYIFFMHQGKIRKNEIEQRINTTIPKKNRAQAKRIYTISLVSSFPPPYRTWLISTSSISIFPPPPSMENTNVIRFPLNPVSVPPVRRISSTPSTKSLAEEPSVLTSNVWEAD